MKNFVENGSVLEVVEDTLTVASGDAIVKGALKGVSISDKDSADRVQLQTYGVFNLPVVAAAPVAIGDKVYCDPAVEPAAGNINDTNTDTEFGIALDAIAAPGTATIRVFVGSGGHS